MPCFRLCSFVAAAALAVGLLPAGASAAPTNGKSTVNAVPSGNGSGSAHGSASNSQQGQEPTARNCDDSIVTVNLSYFTCLGSQAGNIGVPAEGPLVFEGVSYDLIGSTMGDGTDAGPFGAIGHDVNDGELVFDLPRVGTFVIGLKAGHYYSLYKFVATTPVESIQFDTLGVLANDSNGGNNLSHVALYGGQAVQDDPLPSDPVLDVPEPGSAALMLAALALGGIAARRRRA